jgi:hypothetical protein
MDGHGSPDHEDATQGSLCDPEAQGDHSGLTRRLDQAKNDANEATKDPTCERGGNALAYCSHRKARRN